MWLKYKIPLLNNEGIDETDDLQVVDNFFSVISHNSKCNFSLIQYQYRILRSYNHYWSISLMFCFFFKAIYHWNIVDLEAGNWKGREHNMYTLFYFYPWTLYKVYIKWHKSHNKTKYNGESSSIIITTNTFMN